MSASKGKAPANEEFNSQGAKPENQKEAASLKSEPATLPSRILKSAGGLARSFIAPGAAGASSSTSSLAGSSAAVQDGKGGLASASNGGTLTPWASEAAASGAGRTATATESFRSYVPPASIASGDETAQSDDGLWRSQDETWKHVAKSASTHGQADSWLSAFRREGEDLRYAPTHVAPAQKKLTDVEEAQRLDGRDVVQLLGEPGMVLADGPAAMQIQGEYDDAQVVDADDLFSSANMTSDEASTLAKLKSILPPPPVYVGHHEGARSEFFVEPPAGLGHEEEQMAWLDRYLEEWDDVFDNYVDAVWGPDREERRERVKEAKEELRQLQDDGYREKLAGDPVAVRRLKMVLGHFHG